MIDFRIPPKTQDKKTMVRDSAYTLGTRLVVSGRGDHRTNGFCQGTLFTKSHSSSGDSNWVEWQYNDWIEMGGGRLSFTGAILGDFVKMKLFAPATTTTSTPGTGNCNEVNNVLVPAAGDGAKTVDLETSDQAIPLLTTGGYWNWSYPDTGRGTVSAAPNGDGNCNLLTVEYTIHNYVSCVPLLGDGHLNFIFPGIDPTRIIPQWKFGLQLYNVDGSHTLEASWNIVLARIKGV